MTTSTTSHTKSFLSGLSSLFRYSSDSGAPSPTSPPSDYMVVTKSLESAIKDLKSKIKQCREEELKSVNALLSRGPGATAIGPSDAEIKQLELADSLKRMQDQIVEHHRILKTGISTAEISNILDFVKDLKQQIEGDDLDSRIRAAIASDLYVRLALPAWERFCQLLKDSGISWPEPTGLAPGLSAAEKESAIGFRMNEAKELFLTQQFSTCDTSLVGIVPSWGRYPAPDSWLWQELVLRSVATGIRCRLFKTAVEKLRTQAQEIRQEANEMINEHMQQIQQLLRTGIQSLEVAENVVRGTDEVITTLLPALAWKRVESSIKAQ